MKSTYFLALPVATTLLNLLLAFAFFHCHDHQANAQPVLDNVWRPVLTEENYLDKYNEDVYYHYGDVGNCTVSTSHDLMSTHDNPDPMLQSMPGIDFDAYVRADIATCYQQEPGSMQEKKPHYTGQAAKFINMSPFEVDLYWVGDNGPVFSATIKPWTADGTSCFPGAHFIFTDVGNPKDVYCRFHITEDVSVYYYDPYTIDNGSDLSRGEVADDYDEVLDISSLSTHDRQMYHKHKYNIEFGKLYMNFTGGSEWLSMYPPSPPSHPIWRADYFGQEHYVQTTQTHFMQVPQDMRSLSVRKMKEVGDTAAAYSDFQFSGTLNLTLTTISCAPRIFTIDNFLSDAEADHLLELVNKRNDLTRSTTNGHLSETRTSTTTWLGRNSNAATDTIYRRAADVLRIDEALLRQRLDGERPDYETNDSISEPLQIVHYLKGQQYTAHHDFGYTDPNRSINLCMYLNDVDAGGQTSFPRWRSAETSEALNVTPKKGTAMIFYMVNPDGNRDDLSQHAALPVLEGEKWFSNLWIWDPQR